MEHWLTKYRAKASFYCLFIILTFLYNNICLWKRFFFILQEKLSISCDSIRKNLVTFSFWICVNKNFCFVYIIYRMLVSTLVLIKEVMSTRLKLMLKLNRHVNQFIRHHHWIVVLLVRWFWALMILNQLYLKKKNNENQIGLDKLLVSQLNDIRPGNSFKPCHVSI